MKKLSIILNVVLLLVVIFLAVYANIQTKMVQEQKSISESLAEDAVALKGDVEKEAANAREAEAKATRALRDAEMAKNEALLAEARAKDAQASAMALREKLRKCK